MTRPERPITWTAAQTAGASRSPRRRRFLIIRNRYAGRLKMRLATAVADALRAGGAQVQLVETSSEKDMRHTLADAGAVDALVAAGGDGTLRALVSAADGQGLDVPFALLPMGTGNVMARELSLKRRADAIAAMLLDGDVREVHAGEVNGELFLSMCGAGFDGEVIRRLNVPLKLRMGRAAYIWPILASLGRRPEPLAIEVDGRPAEATWVVVSNARHYAGGFVLTPEQSPFTPGLTAVLFGARSRAGRLVELIALASGLLRWCPTVRFEACASLTVATPRVPLQADGDWLGHGRLAASAGARRFRLIVPRS